MARVIEYATDGCALESRAHDDFFVTNSQRDLAAREYQQHEPSQKRDGQFPITEQLRCVLRANRSRNNFMMRNLQPRRISWHAGCVKCPCQPN